MAPTRAALVAMHITLGGTGLRIHFLRGGMLLAMVASLFGAAQSTYAETAPGQIKLGITPVGYSGQYFDITMAPGEVRELTVEVANFGAEQVSALTYATDVYSINGGGFGARLADEPTSGTTLWLGYDARTVDLPAGEGLIREFSVSVPADITPGEYITSLAVQNADPTAANGESIAIRQVQRTVIAVAITVPGDRVPKLSITGFAHEYLAAHSVISASLVNDGNTRLKPLGELVVRESSGAEVSRVAVKMDSVYAGTPVELEAPFSTALLAGDYLVSLLLTFEDGSVEAIDVPMNVPKPTEAEASGAPTGAQTGVLNQAQPGDGSGTNRVLPIAVCVAGVALVGGALFIRRRKFAR